MPLNHSVESYYILQYLLSTKEDNKLKIAFLWIEKYFSALQIILKNK